MSSLSVLLRWMSPRSLAVSWRCHSSAKAVHPRHADRIGVRQLRHHWFGTASCTSSTSHTNEYQSSWKSIPSLNHVNHWTKTLMYTTSVIAKAAPLPQWRRPSCRHAHSSADASVSFQLNDDHVVARRQDKTFHCSYFWLRDHCQCPECYDVNTYQHLVETDTVDPAIVPQTLECNEEGIHVRWPDNHQTILSWDWLEENGPGQQLADNKMTRDKVYWDAATLERHLPPDVRFDDLMSSDKAHKTILETLYTYGIAFVCEVPPTTNDTERAVESIAEILETFYGKMYTFTADLAVADSAYTNETLNTHQDTTYFYEPAGLQVLHCLYHEGTGGENPLVDGFRAADAVRRKYPHHFDALCRIPVVGRYLDNSRNISTLYYTIATNPITQQIDHVRFNIYDRGPLSHLSEEDMAAYYAAVRVLAKEIQDPSNVYQIKLTPGRMMVFDNWRVLHGRKGFTGKRIMTGCYVSRLDYLNKLRTVAGIRV